MKLKTLFILLVVIAVMMSFMVKSYATTGVVNTDTLNLRKEASTDSSVVELLNKNDKVDIISEDGEWYNVKHGNNEGYVKKEFIKVDEQIIYTNVVDTNTAVINTDNEVDNTTTAEEGNEVKTTTKMKLIPSINANDVEEIKAGTKIEIITKTNKWAFIQYQDMTGWIPLVALQESDKERSVQEESENLNNEESTEIVENTENAETESEQSTEESANTSESTEEQTTESNTQEDTTNSGTTYESAVTKYVSASSIYLRSKPTTSSDALTTLLKNADVKATGEEDGWYKVTYGSYTGYIRKDLLSDEKQADVTSRSGNERNETEEVSATKSSGIGNDIVAYAKQYLGCPYVYGAAGSSSFDCSGFTMYVYKHFGYNLSHSATAQSKVGSYVSKDNLQPGDLVFFLDYETMDGIGHVGIYIGNGNFIHASSGSGYCVKTSTLTSGSYLKRYVTARRLY